MTIDRFEGRPPGFIPANFTFSAKALEEIEYLRSIWIKETRQVPGIVTVSWGLCERNDGYKYELIIVSFYGKEEYNKVKKFIQIVSGVKIVFYTTEQYAHKFYNKQIDFEKTKGFYFKD